MGLASSSLFYCCTLEEGNCITNITHPNGSKEFTCNVDDSINANYTNYCTQEACQTFYERELTDSTCNKLKYYPALTEEQQWALALIAAVLGIMTSYISLMCLPVLFHPAYGIFRVFLSSFTLTLLISMSIFELLPAALGMNECEAAMWPHWPVHASLMYVSFWFYYTLDRCIAVFGHDAQDPFKPGFQAPNANSWNNVDITEMHEKQRNEPSVSAIATMIQASNKVLATSAGKFIESSKTSKTTDDDEIELETNFQRPLTPESSRSNSHDGDDDVFDGQENEAFDDEFDYIRKEGVVRTNKTIVKYQQKKTVTTKQQRYSAINKKDVEAAYHKHGFSWQNIKSVQSTAWLTVAGDAVENVVHGIAITCAFNESFPGGLGISLVVCMEEFLHKINDFAVLMTMGMNTHEALFFNMMSSIPMFFGIVICGSVIHFTNPPDCYDANHFESNPACHQSEQYCAAAALGLTIYIAFGGVLGEANAAELACQQTGRLSRKWILFIQQVAHLCGLGTCILINTLVPRTIFDLSQYKY